MKKSINLIFVVCMLSILVVSCNIPKLAELPAVKKTPDTFKGNASTNSSGNLPWRQFYNDKFLIKLIDTALSNNQELKIALQEIEISKNEVLFQKGKLTPKVEAGGGLGIDKVARYTSQGAGDASTEITPGKEVPEWLPDINGRFFASWEVDIWKKIRNSKQAALYRYLSTVEGRNFIITNLIAEIANNYYELLALDNDLLIVNKNIALQSEALQIIKVQKEANEANELAVKKFEAEIQGSQSLQFDILQKIAQKEFDINLLTGCFPKHIERDTSNFLSISVNEISAGLPSEMITNRTDIKQAELQLKANKLDVAVAKADFFPELNIRSALGLQAFNPAYLIRQPESFLFNLVGDLAAPIINKNAIKAEYKSANARQIQALYNYERNVLTAFIEVNSQLSKIELLKKKYERKNQQVETLTKAIDISKDLYKANRADYLEVLLNQRDVLDSKLELVETKLNELIAKTNIYRALGGGWH